MLYKIIYLLLFLVVGAFSESNSVEDKNSIQININNENTIINYQENFNNIYGDKINQLKNPLKRASLRTVSSPAVFDGLLGKWNIAFKIIDTFTYSIVVKEVVYQDSTYGYVAEGYIQYAPSSIKVPMKCFYDEQNSLSRNDYVCVSYNGQYFVWYYLNQNLETTITGEYDITTSGEDARINYENGNTFFLIGIKKQAQTVVIPL